MHWPEHMLQGHTTKGITQENRCQIKSWEELAANQLQWHHNRNQVAPILRLSYPQSIRERAEERKRNESQPTDYSSLKKDL